MGKTKKLTKKDLDYFKKILINLRTRVASEIGQLEGDYLKKNSKESSGDLSGYSFHMADMASDTFDTDFNLGLISSEVDILQEIDDALKRIEDGSYGICEKYKTPITKERLKAMPYARYCIEAQEEVESSNRKKN